MRPFNQPTLLGICFALLLTACAVVPTAPTATVEYDHGYDFSRVHKIAIQPIARGTLATMLISDAQITRIDQALRAELLRRGFEVVTVNADADMFLSWMFTPQESAEVSTFDPATQQISRGTLYVNMIDPLMLQSEWRATFQSDLRDQPETATAAEYRAAAAQVILEQFPPGSN